MDKKKILTELGFTVRSDSDGWWITDHPPDYAAPIFLTELEALEAIDFDLNFCGEYVLPLMREKGFQSFALEFYERYAGFSVNFANNEGSEFRHCYGFHPTDPATAILTAFEQFIDSRNG